MRRPGSLPCATALTTRAGRRAKGPPASRQCPYNRHCGAGPGHRVRARGRSLMRIQASIAVAALAALVAMAGAPAMAQGVGKYLAPRDQVVAIRAGKLFDARTGALLNNQVIVVRGDRIADVGAAVEIPAGATVIDLSNATVL